MAIGISGFTFVHNAIDSGYPIVEAIRIVSGYVDEIVVVDMQSTDGTRETLEKMASESSKMADFMGSINEYPPIKIINGFWGDQAGETLKDAHSQYVKCSNDIIIHFEADEVYDPVLLENIIVLLQQGITDIAVYRLQLEQNFQRCRWYPEPVHRVFRRFSRTVKDGHTTNHHEQATVLPPESGYLWDITNCFRDNWLNRVHKQAELRRENPNYLMVPIHTTHEPHITEWEAQQHITSGRHWHWKATPFNIPDILKPLVGKTKYEPSI